MADLCLLTPGTRVHLDGEQLRVELLPAEPGLPAETFAVPLREVETCIITSAVHLSIPALAECLRRGINVLITARGGHVLGCCQALAPHSAARLTQYERALEQAYACRLAGQWAHAKIHNARRLLQRLAENRGSSGTCVPVLDTLANLRQRCTDATTPDSIRGFEGAAAQLYFQALDVFFPPSCPLERRSRRPPHNPANALLSFAYSLLVAELECQVVAAGLDPAVGFLHVTADRRPALVLDLLEPFRAPVADALAVDLLGHGILKPDEHFEPVQGGVYLNIAGRRRFLSAYETRLNREFDSEQHQRRTSLRQELRADVLALKRALLEHTVFEPYVMN
jgi:CRISPR-associated protein Cas1